mgnify:CR=1 FL=1
MARRRRCRLCSKKVNYVDYKDTELLQSFINEYGKIMPRRITGNCAYHQRLVTTAIKRARNIALLPISGR